MIAIFRAAIVSKITHGEESVGATGGAFGAHVYPVCELRFCQILNFKSTVPLGLPRIRRIWSGSTLDSSASVDARDTCDQCVSAVPNQTRLQSPRAGSNYGFPA